MDHGAKVPIERGSAEATYQPLCDQCGWCHHGEEHPPRERWRTWEQRAREAERVIVEMGAELRRLRADHGRERDQANPYSLLQTQAFIRERDDALAKKRAGGEKASVEIRRLRMALEEARAELGAGTHSSVVARIITRALDSSRNEPEGGKSQ